MKKHIFYVLISTVSIVFHLNVSAALVTDFEGTGLAEAATITNQISGVTISGGSLGIQGGVQSFGAPFGPGIADTGAPFSGDFLRPESYDLGNILRIDFDNPHKAFSFSLADIDPVSINLEILEITVYDISNTVLQNFTLQSDDPDTGNGYATFIQIFSSGAAAIEFETISNDAAYGIDNIQTTIVPVPAAILFYLSGLMGLATLGRKRRG